MTVGYDSRTAASADEACLLPIETADFRRVLGRFASGVTVVTSMAGTEPVGFACQSFFSVSLDPPLIGFCAGKSSTTWPRIRRSGHFCVNILSEHQSDLSRAFAARGNDKFRGVGWRLSRLGNPHLHGGLAWIDCDIHHEYDSGDHVVVMGGVTTLDAAQEEDGRPLLFYRGGYGRFSS